MEGLELRLGELWSYWLIRAADIYMDKYIIYMHVYMYIFVRI